MPHFDHTGPEGTGSRTGRGMGQCMNRGGKGRMAMQGGMGNPAETAQMPEQGTAQDMGQNMGQNMRQNMGQETGQDMGQGRCCRHGQRHGSMKGSCAMRGAEAGRGMGQGRNGAMRQQCRCGAGQPQTGTAPSAEAGSDGAENNS